MLSISHDCKLRVEDWCEEWGEGNSQGFLHPAKFLDDLKVNRTNYLGKKNIFLFDRQWENKIDLVHDPIMNDIREQAKGIDVKWVLTSNRHEFGDRLKNWDLVKDGEVISKEKLLNLLIISKVISKEESLAY